MLRVAPIDQGLSDQWKTVFLRSARAAEVEFNSQKHLQKFETKRACPLGCLAVAVFEPVVSLSVSIPPFTAAGKVPPQVWPVITDERLTEIGLTCVDEARAREEEALARKWVADTTPSALERHQHRRSL